MSVAQKETAPRNNSSRLLTTLIVGFLLGASLGPALFLAVERLELSGDLLLSFAIGAFLTFGICLAVAAVAALLIVPRIFASARGTLAGIVNDLTEASRAHARGDANEALRFVGRAAEEGAAWYSVGATRRFVAQAALGLLISFGGVVGAVLLFSQNALLRDQNGMIKSQTRLLDQQNKKIDQQTMVADAQKRGAFATEMFSIVQEVAKARERTPDGNGLSAEIVARIVVLTSSAVPYLYLDFRSETSDDAAQRIAKPLSPERGQILAALARMKVDLSALGSAGSRFDQADLRGIDLDGANLRSLDLHGSDLSGANISRADLSKADLSGANLRMFTLSKLILLLPP